MKSLNFEFVRSAHPQLAEYGALAEHHLGSDPAASIVKLRMSAEYLVEQIYERRHLGEPKSREGGDPDLCDLLNNRAFTGAVPKPVVDALHFVRLNGKRGAHHGYATDRDAALESLRRVHDVARWFVMSVEGAAEPDVFDASALAADVETRRTLKREREEALRKASRLTGEVRRLQEELISTHDAAARLRTERTLGERVASLLALHEQAEATQAEKLEAVDELDVCRRRIAENIGKNVAGIVTPSVADGRTALVVVTEAVASHRHVTVVGRSGIGKSHLALHTGSVLAMNGRVAFVARARYFDGHLDDWLDRAVASFTRHTAATVFRMAAAVGERPILIVDGFDECSQRHVAALIESLQALVLREATTLIITAQQPAGLPFATDVVQLEQYSDGEKQEILRIYAPTRVLDAQLVKALSTPFELELAARCAAELGSSSSTHDVLAAYVRRSIPASRAEAAFRLLLDLANELSQKLRFSVNVAKLYRLGAMSGAGSSEELVRSLVDGAMLHVEEGMVSFRHELLLEYFIAELLLREARSTAQLAERLESPRYRTTLGLLLQAVASEGDLVPLLLQSKHARALLPQLADGTLGATARGIVLEEMSRLTVEARESLREVRVTTVEVDHSERPVVLTSGTGHTAENDTAASAARPVDRRAQFAQNRAWSDYEHAIFSAVGAIAHTQAGVALARPLIEATDQMVERSREQGVPRVLAYHELYGVLRLGAAMPASLIVGSARQLMSGSRSIPDPTVVDLAGNPEALTPGLTFLVCLFLRNAMFGEASPERREHIAALVPALLAHAWKGGFYHLRLQALDLVRWTASAGTATIVEQLKEVVGAIDTKGNIWLNTAWIDAADALGMVEPPCTAEEVGQQIKAILGSEDDPEARAWAYTVYANQLEEVLGAPHIEAIADLAPVSRLRLCSMASLGATSTSFSLDMCLREVVEHPNVASDPLAIEAIRRWSPAPPKKETFPDQAVAAFALATLGRAVLALGLHQEPRPVGASEAAWLAWGEVLYWTTIPNLDAATRRARAAHAWTRLLENPTDAISPLYWLHKHQRFVSFDARTRWFDIVEAWSSEVAKLLESVAGRLDELTSAFSFPDRDVGRFVVHQLALLPPSRAHALLRPLADRSDVGAEVVSLLRELGLRET